MLHNGVDVKLDVSIVVQNFGSNPCHAGRRVFRLLQDPTHELMIALRLAMKRRTRRNTCVLIADAVAALVPAYSFKGIYRVSIYYGASQDLATRFDNATVLISGAAGFIGYSLALKLAQSSNGTDVRLRYARADMLSHFPNNVRLVQGDVCDSLFMRELFALPEVGLRRRDVKRECGSFMICSPTSIG